MTKEGRAEIEQVLKSDIKEFADIDLLASDHKNDAVLPLAKNAIPPTWKNWQIPPIFNENPPFL